MCDAEEPVCLRCTEPFPVRPAHPQLRVCVTCEPRPQDLQDSGSCPTCGWDSDNGEPTQVTITDYRLDWEYGYLGGAHWTEHWTCPLCQTAFSFPNSSV